MKKVICIISVCFALLGCTRAQDTTKQALDKVGDETNASWNELRNILDLGHPAPEKKMGKAQSRYCYKTYEDVICYTKPMQGEEYRLVGYQEPAGNSGYTLPPGYVPPPDEPAKPALAPLKAVDVGTAPKVKETADSNTTDKTQKPKKTDKTAKKTTKPITQTAANDKDQAAKSKPPAPAVASDTPGSTTSGKKQLKEVVFDPSELEPKQLVPDKTQ
jgi:hypothetical protein